MATIAVLGVSSLDESLLNGRLQVKDTTVQVNGPGMMAVQLPPQAVPLEEAGRLAEVDIPPTSTPRDVRVRWQAIRTGGAHASARVQLIGSGVVQDLTRDYESLPIDKAIPMERTLRLGPDPTRVRLRLAWDPPPPATFFSAKWEGELGGFALDTGGKDVATLESPDMYVSNTSPIVVSGHHQANVAIVQSIDANALVHVVGQLLDRDWDVQTDRHRRFPQSHQVIVQAKNLATVNSQPLKDAVAVQQSVVIDADLGVLFGEVLAVDVDLLRHGIREFW